MQPTLTIQQTKSH